MAPSEYFTYIGWLLEEKKRANKGDNEVAVKEALRNVLLHHEYKIKVQKFKDILKPTKKAIENFLEKGIKEYEDCLSSLDALHPLAFMKKVRDDTREPILKELRRDVSPEEIQEAIWGKDYKDMDESKKVGLYAKKLKEIAKSDAKKLKSKIANTKQYVDKVNNHLNESGTLPLPKGKNPNQDWKHDIDIFLIKQKWSFELIARKVTRWGEETDFPNINRKGSKPFSLSAIKNRSSKRKKGRVGKG